MFSIHKNVLPELTKELKQNPISLSSSLQALCGVVFEVPTLDGDKLRISTMQEIIKPNTVKRVQGYGLPHPKDTARKGDLLIAFDIKFPEKLTSSEKELLGDLLPN